MASRTPAADPPGDFPTDAALRAFSRQVPAEQRRFDDRRLLAYRHPQELPSLAVALAVVLLGLGLVVRWSWAAGVALIGVLLLTALVTRLSVAQQLAHGAEVTATQFGHLYPLVAELRDRFGVPRTRVFVTQSPVINATSSGFREPYVVVLNSALVEALDQIELKNVLGHELGHVKFGHTRLSVLLGGLDARAAALPFPFNLVATARDAVFLWWQRSTELSADRAGIVACGRVSKAMSAQLKVAVGPTLYQHVNLDDLARQAAALRTGVGRVEGFLSQLGASHPFLLNRLQAMLDFVGEPTTEAPTPRPPLARLVVRDGASAPGEGVLEGGRLLVGRSPSADLQLRDRAVSRRHCEIGWEDGAYVVRDLDSNNGVFVNGRRVAAARLADGDVIRLGITELEFSCHE